MACGKWDLPLENYCIIFDTYDVCIRHGLETCKERSEEDTHLRSVALLSAIVFYIVEDY